MDDRDGGVVSAQWDERYLGLATLVSYWSKDRSTKVGCVIVGEAGQVLSTGYNGFPRGIDDDAAQRHARPAKYLWTEHAERNAVYNAARTGTSLLGSSLYLPWFPCADCARAIIQSGIAVLVVVEVKRGDAQWDESIAVSKEMLAEAGVIVRWHEPR